MIQSSPNGSSVPQGSSGCWMHHDPMRASKRTLLRSREAASSSPGAALLRASAATPARPYVTGKMMRFSTPVSTCARKRALLSRWHVRTFYQKSTPAHSCATLSADRTRKPRRRGKRPTPLNAQDETHLFAPVVDSVPLDLVGLAALVDLILRVKRGQVRFSRGFHASQEE